MPVSTENKNTLEKENKIFFYVPMEKSYMDLANENIQKAKSGNKVDPKGWKIGGYASSADEDLDGESIDPKGIDLSYMLKYGLFNSDHQKGPEHIVGVIEEAYVDDKGLYVKGYLLQGVPEAEAIYRLMQTLAIGGHDRKMGFSIEGKVLEQIGGRITKCWGKAVAITMSPVNTKTYAEILKSIHSNNLESLRESSDVIKSEEIPLEEVKEHTNTDKGQFEKIISLAEEITKEAKRLIEEDTEEFGKGLVAGNNAGPAESMTGGDALRAQDLDNKPKVTTNAEDEDSKLVEYTMKKGVIDDIETARKVVKYARLLKGQGKLPE